MDDKKHIVAVNAFIKSIKGDRFLIVKRHSKEIGYPGKWAFPGGKMERGQDIMETLNKEVKEEVGLKIEDSKVFLDDFTFVRKDSHNVIGLIFLVRAKSEDVKLSKDFEDFKWITPDELEDYDYIKGMEKTVKTAFRK